jgi:hypothetical protein
MRMPPLPTYPAVGVSSVKVGRPKTGAEVEAEVPAEVGTELGAGATDCFAWPEHAAIRIQHANEKWWNECNRKRIGAFVELRFAS